MEEKVYILPVARGVPIDTHSNFTNESGAFSQDKEYVVTKMTAEHL